VVRAEPTPRETEVPEPANPYPTPTPVAPEPNASEEERAAQLGQDVIAGHLAAYRFREATAFAEALHPDRPSLETLWPVAASLAENARWLDGLPLGDAAARPLVSRLATLVIDTLERSPACQDAGCEVWNARARRFLPFVDGARRDRVLPLLEQRDAKLAPWRAPRPAVFGVLLPLSGPHEAFGKAAREALDLVTAAFPGVTLVYRDTQANPDVAATEAERLVFEDRVSALIGPVGRLESAPVVSFSRRWLVAHLPLGSSLEPAELGVVVDPVLRVRTSPLELAEALARYARGELGKARVAILASTDTAMTDQAAAFALEWERQGGTVVRTVAFDPNAKSLDGPLGELVQSDNKKKGKVDFDTLYLAAPGAVARRVASHFSAWGIPIKLKPDQKRRSKKHPEPVQLLGSSGWLTSQVIDRTDGVTQNAIFADTWAPDLDDPQTLAFIGRFEAAHKKRPTAFHAEVFDALRVAVDADLEARVPVFAVVDPNDPSQAPGGELASESPRVRLARALLRDRTTPLAAGPLTVKDGKAQPRAHLLTVHGEQIRSRRTEDEERLLFTPPETPPETGPAPLGAPGRLP
jgi:ABC-type branched-subunit amino acid transport system substrate-binding protein